MSSRIEGDTLFYGSSPRENRASFIEFVEPSIEYLVDGEYKARYGNNIPYARFRADCRDLRPGHLLVRGVSIQVDTDAFNVDGVSYHDLIPTFVKHEVEELWAIAKPGKLCEGGSVFKMNSQGHKYALRQQFRYAFSQGKAERLIDFWQASLPHEVENELARELLLREQLQAYFDVFFRQPHSESSQLDG